MKNEAAESSFSNLVLMLATGALQSLGIIENPVSKKKELNIEVAKRTIDSLEMLREKTKGNLDDSEKELLEGLLHDLRLKYLEIKEKTKTDS